MMRETQHLAGSYANIDGGRIAEALADLTGSELHER
jgi:hypothetical protein